MGESGSEHLIAEIIEEVEVDADGQVSHDQVMDLIAKKHVQRMESECPEGKLTADEQDLVDEGNTVIPGGKHDPKQKPKYVYDRRSNSVQKSPR